MKRNIHKIVSAFKINMGGVFLDQALPHQTIDQLDPFLLIHHLDQSYTVPKKQEKVGVPPHPHRGFAPVTFVFKGGVHHRDSIGNDSVIYEGGTQWMHAGSGIIHSERPAKEIAEQAGGWELIQFWVNLPASHKMTPPQYFPLTKEGTPTILSQDKKVEIAVVAGDYKGTKGGIEAFSPILALRLNFQEGGRVNIPVPEQFNALTYQLDGQLLVNQKEISKAKDLVVFEQHGKEIELQAQSDTRAILLAGLPIKEPVKSHGPFVMNSQKEIVEAVNDFRAGKMGELTEIFE